MKTHKGVNHFEYSRGIIVASILWGGFVIFVMLTSIVTNMIEWAFGRGWLSTVMLLLYILPSAMLLVRIGHLAFSKLTRNRFKYFSTEKIIKVLENKK